MLYGFGSLDERALFRQLIRISGVGARTALALLSGLSVNDMSQAVALQDASRLTSIPGIGKKTADRLLLELKGKLETGALSAISSSVQNDAMADIQNALLALGYSEKETILAIRYQTTVAFRTGLKWH